MGLELGCIVSPWRQWDRQPWKSPPEEEKVHWLEQFLSYAYIFACLCFVVGSICFLPSCSACYSHGVYLYVVGGFIFLKCALFDYEEALNNAGGRKPKIYEAIMNEIYVVGTVFYLIATVLYAPSVYTAVGAYRSELFGGIGFIVGSLFFIFACYLNGMHTGIAFTVPEDVARSNPDLQIKIHFARICVLATSSCSMLGSLLFLVGSVLYLPVLGCNDMTAVIGTWQYIIGSLFFFAGGVIPVLRRKYANIEYLVPQQKGGPTDEKTNPRSPLVGTDKKSPHGALDIIEGPPSPIEHKKD